MAAEATAEPTPFISEPEVPWLDGGNVEVCFDDTRLPRALHTVAEVSEGTVCIYAADGEFGATARDPAHVWAAQGAVPAQFPTAFRAVMDTHEFSTFLAEFEGAETAWFDGADHSIAFSKGTTPVVDLTDNPGKGRHGTVEAGMTERSAWPTVEAPAHALASGLTGAAIQRLYDGSAVELRTDGYYLVAEPVDQSGSEEYLVCEVDTEERIRSQFSDDYLRELTQALVPTDYRVTVGDDTPLLLANDQTKIALAHRPIDDGGDS